MDVVVWFLLTVALRGGGGCRRRCATLQKRQFFLLDRAVAVVSVRIVAAKVANFLQSRCGIRRGVPGGRGAIFHALQNRQMFVAQVDVRLIPAALLFYLLANFREPLFVRLTRWRGAGNIRHVFNAAFMNLREPGLAQIGELRRDALTFAKAFEMGADRLGRAVVT